MKEPVEDISVVIATFNGEKYLRPQIDSILAQSHAPKEIIVIDDCSVDNTMNILRGYALLDKRFKIIQNETNLGYIRNFEKGMQIASCALVALSDQDDIWLPNKLKTLYSHIGEYLLVYSDSELVDAAGNMLNKKMSHIKNQIAYSSCLMYTIGAWAPGHSMLMKRELIEKCLPFPSQVTHDFWLGFVATCYSKIQYVNEPLVYYRQHSDNAIGANTKQSPKIKYTRSRKLKKIRERMKLLYEKCPVENVKEKQILKTIHESYQSFSLQNNWKRMSTFFRYRNLILAYKKKSELMKILFSLKLFFKID